MNQQLKTVLEYIKTEYNSKALTGARNYLNVNIGKVALKLGYTAVHQAYENSHVIVSLKGPVPGMKVRIDGRTFVNYAEYYDGFAVPRHIAKKAGMPIKPYIANDSMILNFA